MLKPRVAEDRTVVPTREQELSDLAVRNLSTRSPRRATFADRIMRKFVLDLLDYLRTGQRLPHCALCDSRYNDAKPLIEGATGALVCAGCVRRLTATDGVDRNMYVAAHRALHSAERGNPYRPPKIDDRAVPCLLCDELTDSPGNQHGKLTAVICSTCLRRSIHLLEGREDE